MIGSQPSVAGGRSDAHRAAVEPWIVTSNPLKGLTWSHVRGYGPLEAMVRDRIGPIRPIVWDRQPLSGFESASIAELAKEYDLLMIDHPNVGAAVAANALLPFEEVLQPAELSSMLNQTIAGSFDSYFYDSLQWAVPVDAAAQVCAYRPDLLPEPPATWREAIALSEHQAVAVPTSGPHALLTLLGMVAALQPGFQPGVDRFLPAEAALVAYEWLTVLYERTPSRLRGLDPIELLDAMATSDIACLPLVFGYAAYSRPAQGRCFVAFVDAPAAEDGWSPGSVLGGVGLAISRHCDDRESALGHVRAITSETVQVGTFPASGGQPAAVAAWFDPDVDRASGSFYSSTRRSQTTAWMRPRFPGWAQVQFDGGQLVAAALRDGTTPERVLEQLEQLYVARRGQAEA
jgi:multiple sugar transport system substrate-binding protein